MQKLTFLRKFNKRKRRNSKIGFTNQQSNESIRSLSSSFVQRSIKKRKISYSSLAVKFSVLIFVFSILVQVYISSNVSVKTDEMSDLMVKKADLESEVQLIQLELSKYSSLSYIEKEATALGFKKSSAQNVAIGPAEYSVASADFTN